MFCRCFITGEEIDAYLSLPVLFENSQCVIVEMRKNDTIKI
jgi:hypothetical protein